VFGTVVAQAAKAAVRMVLNSPLAADLIFESEMNALSGGWRHVAGWKSVLQASSNRYENGNLNPYNGARGSDAPKPY